jgi:hypothetical protein
VLPEGTVTITAEQTENGYEVTFDSTLTTDQVLALLRHTITDIEVTRRFGGAA